MANVPMVAPRSRDQYELLRQGFTIAHQSPDGTPRTGTNLEFGVRAGGSLLWMAKEAKEKYPEDVIYAFDSWEGLPEEDENVWRPDRHNKGKFTVGKFEVESQLRKAGVDGFLQSTSGGNTHLVDGFFSDSLTESLREEIPTPIIFVNIDCDLYISTIQVLDWLTPIVAPGCVFHFDDWSSGEREEKWGEELAYEEWANKTGAKTETLAIADHGRRILRLLNQPK